MRVLYSGYYDSLPSCRQGFNSPYPLMDIKDLLKNAQHLTDYEFEQKLNKLARDNYRYRNLDEKNRGLVFDILKKYRGYLRKGIGISYSTLQNESYRLYQNRLKLGLTEDDLKDIKEILSSFKR